MKAVKAIFKTTISKTNDLAHFRENCFLELHFSDRNALLLLLSFPLCLWRLSFQGTLFPRLQCFVKVIITSGAWRTRKVVFVNEFRSSYQKVSLSSFLLSDEPSLFLAETIREFFNHLFLKFSTYVCIFICWGIWFVCPIQTIKFDRSFAER